MSTRIFLSIIVPVYNHVNFIERCIQSLRPFIRDLNCEVIIVNDGSTDGVAEVLASLSEENVLHYNRPHLGVSAARNFGIDQARGTYLTFLDIDDYLNFDAGMAALSLLRSGEYNILIMNSFTINSTGNRDVFYRNGGIHGVFNTRMLIKLGYYRGSACGVFFHRDFIQKNSIYFPLISYGEDSLFITRCILKSDSTYILDMNFYEINYNESGSLSRLEKSVLFSYFNEMNRVLADLSIGVSNEYHSYVNSVRLRFVLNSYYKIYLLFGLWKYIIWSYKLKGVNSLVKVDSYKTFVFKFLFPIVLLVLPLRYAILSRNKF